MPASDIFLLTLWVFNKTWEFTSEAGHSKCSLGLVL